jgi:hypothetical protein
MEVRVLSTAPYSFFTSISCVAAFDSVSHNMRNFTVLAMVLGIAAGVCRGQAHPAQANELNDGYALPSCTKARVDTRVCRVVLSDSIDAKKSNVGDHHLLRMALTMDPAEPVIAMLDAVIIEVPGTGKGSSRLRIRINRELSKDGHELPVQANILAIASEPSLTEAWDFPVIIADRFPQAPENEQRLPGEMTLSEDQCHTSRLDALPDLPVHHTMVCTKKVMKLLGKPCVDLLEARGIYGYKGVTLEPGDPASPADSILSSKKNIRLQAQTVLVAEIKETRGEK